MASIVMAVIVMISAKHCQLGPCLYSSFGFEGHIPCWKISIIGSGLENN